MPDDKTNPQADFPNSQANPAGNVSAPMSSGGAGGMDIPPPPASGTFDVPPPPPVIETASPANEIYPSPPPAPETMPPSFSVAPPSVQTTETSGPAIISSDSSRPPSKLPIKAIVLGLVALIFLGIAAFIIRYLGSQKAVSQEVTLTYWGLWEDSPTLSGLLSEYQKSHPNVKINYQMQSKEDYRERLMNSLVKGDGPDIFRYHNTWVPMLTSQLAPLPPDVMDVSTYQTTFYPVAVQDLRRGTEIVGIPLMFDGLGLYINDSIFTAAGKTPPATWDELRRLARELTIRDAEGRIQQAGVALGRTDNVDHWQDILALMMLQDGADLASPTGENAEKPLKFFTVFNSEDKVWDETLPLSTQAFGAGKLAMYFGPSWRAFEIKQQNPGLKFRIIPVPQLPKADSTQPNVAWASYWAEGVWNKSKDTRAAWEFLQFLAQKESLQKIYAQASQTRLFGEIYPRADMASLLQDDPYTGAFVKDAPVAKSWYLAGRTYDGPTGINTRISNYYLDAVNGVVLQDKDPKDVLPTVAQGVAQVLQSYSAH